MRWPRVTFAVGCAVGALVFAGCATPGYNPTRLQSQLEHAGTTAEQARCVTNALVDTFDENQLGSHSAPTQNELATTRAILAKCKVTLPLQPQS